MRYNIITKALAFFSLFLFCVACQPEKGGDVPEPEKEVAPEPAPEPEKEAKVIELSEAEFGELIFDFKKKRTEWKYKGNTPIVLDFYTTWCGHCTKLRPTLEELAKEYKDRVIIYAIDAEQSPNLSQAIPIKGTLHSISCPHRE